MASPRAQSGPSGDPPAPAAPPPAPAHRGRRRPTRGPPEPAPKTEQLAPVEHHRRPRPTTSRSGATRPPAKIIVGREEIDRFGDSTLGDVLKRLPGVTIQGRPGRGGAIRMRGLGNGYTQILLDGERVPPGFSLDSLTPDQIERIEILRAPTAETGARAIAGTINIITREGYTQRVNDLRLTPRTRTAAPAVGLVDAQLSGGRLDVNYSLSGFYYERDNSSTTTTVDTLADDTVHAGAEAGRLRAPASAAAGFHGNGRLQWRRRRRHRRRDADAGRLLQPGSFARRSILTQSVGARPCRTTRPTPTASTPRRCCA